MLAGLVRAPSALAPTRNLDAAREQAALALQAMIACVPGPCRRYPPVLAVPVQGCFFGRASSNCRPRVSTIGLSRADFLDIVKPKPRHSLVGAFLLPTHAPCAA
jgi:hypothetical protein